MSFLQPSCLNEVRLMAASAANGSVACAIFMQLLEGTHGPWILLPVARVLAEVFIAIPRGPGCSAFTHSF